MGLFSFLKKEKKAEINSEKLILGMILLKENNSMEIDKVISELKEKWKFKVENAETDNETSIIEINDYRIAIVNMPVPIPGDEVKTTAKFNYFWENGDIEATSHKGHIILTIINGGKDPVTENVLFTKLATSIMNNSNALGIYIGGRTLALEKDFYTENAEMMTDQDLPIYNWIYFGMNKENGGNSIYSYGLADFGKLEMEIVNSKHPMDELQELMFNLTHYIVASNVILKDGETIGMSETQKLKLSITKGKYLEGKTLKIEY
ncbi:MAG: hypothetical protein COB81_03075 [Flavobacteriaceae bacterium]|nr:MAG: hypothetical protein COB81_03075 [Flavobacteriaceae bacterium]